MIKFSEQIDAISAAIAKAQAEVGHPSEEATILRKHFGNKEKSGCQHSRRSLADRLLNRIAFGWSDCWHWMGPVNYFGYGRITYQGRMQMVHRLSYMTFKGEIEEGKSVLHSCDNPSCINPEHLRLGTYSDNKQDALTRGRWVLKNKQQSKIVGEIYHKAKLLRESGLSYKKIAEQIGFSTSPVWKALTKENA